MHRCLKIYNMNERYIFVHANEGDSLVYAMEGDRLAREQLEDTTAKKRKKSGTPPETVESTAKLSVVAGEAFKRGKHSSHYCTLLPFELHDAMDKRPSVNHCTIEEIIPTQIDPKN